MFKVNALFRRAVLGATVLVIFAIRPVWSLETRLLMVSWEKKKVEYRISLTKEIFFIYEPVLAELWIKNPNADTVKIWTQLKWEDWSLQDQNGKYYKLNIHVTAFPSEIPIPSGDSLGNVRDFRDYGETNPDQPYPYGFLPVGEYKLSYQIGDDRTAPPLTFKVVEPTGEEGEALKSYLDAYKPIQRGENFYNASTDERIRLNKESMKKLVAFVDRHPKSVYSAHALESASSKAWMFGEGGLAYRLETRRANEYGDPTMRHFDFLHMYHVMTRRDTAGYLAELDSIMRKSANPRLKFEARKALERFNELKAKE